MTGVPGMMDAFNSKKRRRMSVARAELAKIAVNTNEAEGMAATAVRCSQ
jgi:hypothetical protein